MSQGSTFTFGQDVLDKATGSALYTRDLLDRGAVLVGLVRSPLPHARIARLDVRGAAAVPGVLCVLTGDDFEGLRIGHLIQDQPILADGVVRHHGEPVAAVAAETLDALRAGVAAVRASYEPLPAALTPDEAVGLGIAIHEGCPDNVASVLEVDRGDWGAATARVDVWAEGEFSTQLAQHAYMEPHAVLATYETDRIVLHAPVHDPHSLLEEYSSLTARWEERLEIRTPYIGGSFGAKYEHPLHLICAELARRLRRDVGIVLTRREDFLQATPRVNMSLRVRIGATADGRLVAKESAIVANNGAYSLHAPSVYRAATVRMDNLYRWEAIRAQARLVYTNTPPTQCFRGFGNPQAAFAQEQLVDEIGRRLGISPLEIRRRSAIREGDVSIHGWKIRTSGLLQCLDEIEARLEADRASPESEGSTGSLAVARPACEVSGRGRRYRVGYGTACGAHVVSNRSATPQGDFARVRLSVSGDGTILVHTGEVEVGAGTVATLISLVARELGVARDGVRVILGDTERTPFGYGSFASRTAFFAGNAAIAATRKLREAMATLRGDLSVPPDAGPAAVAAAAGAAGRLEDLDVIGEYVPADVEPVDETWKGNISPTYTFSAHACKVVVDTWTGHVEVVRYWAAHDAGTILNETGALGQVYGGVMQGLGFALFEGAVLDEAGRVRNPGFLDYRIPTFPDSVPVEAIFVETYEEEGPLGAKSIAEPPIIPVAACVANAIHDATGWRVRGLPMEPETVFRAGHPEVFLPDDAGGGPSTRVVMRSGR